MVRRLLQAVCALGNLRSNKATPRPQPQRAARRRRIEKAGITPGFEWRDALSEGVTQAQAQIAAARVVATALIGELAEILILKAQPDLLGEAVSHATPTNKSL